MAANDAAVVVTLRADLKAYESALKTAVRQTERAAQAAEQAVGNVGKRNAPDFRAMNDNFRKATRLMENDAKSSQSKLQGIFKSDAIAGRLGAAAAGGFSLKNAQELIDTSTRITNALKIAGLSGSELTAVYERLFAVAQKNAVPIEDLVQLYSRLSAASKDLNASQGDMDRFLEGVAQSMRLSGQSSSAMAGALQQLGQAMGGGKVQAEEYGSLIDGLRPMLQAVAAGMKEAGGSVSKLTELVKEGKVSSEAFFRAAIAGAPLLGEKLAGAESTVSQAFVRLNNVLVDTAGKFDKATGAGKSLADFINGPLTKAISDVYRLLEQLAKGPVGNIIGGIQTSIDKVMQDLLQLSADLGKKLGTDKIGGQPFESDFRREQRLKQEIPDRRGRELEGPVTPPLIKPITLEDFKVKGEKAGDAYMDGLKKAFLGGQSDIEGLNKTFAESLSAFIGAAPGKINIFSAHRTQERQSELFQAAVKKYGSVEAARKFVAAPSPDAPHVKGIAADLKFESDAVKKWAHDNAEAYGLVFRLSHEGWHIELADQSKVRSSRRNTLEETMKGTQAEIALKKQINDINANTALSEDQKTMAISRATAEAERAALVEKLLNQARAEGLEITPQLRAEIEALAAAQQAASVQGDAVKISVDKQNEALRQQKKEAKEAEQAMADLLESIGQMAGNAIVGFVRDLRNGVSAAEALSNAVSRIADQLLSMALNMMITNLLKGISGGMGGGFLPGMASGGYTGDRQPGTPAGIVHGQEFVINANATKRHRALLEAINRGAPGYASGGFVLPSMRSVAWAAPAMSPSPIAVTSRNTVVNTFDAGSFLSEALSKPDGVNVILNAVRAQPAAFRSAMQG